MYLFLCIILIAGIGYSTQEKIKVTVYYESLCPGSIDFITKQLYPGYQLLGDDALAVEMVPVATTAKQVDEQENKWHMRCQHGKPECYANKVQACVLHLNITQEVMMSFFGCHLGIQHPELKTNIKKCLRKNKLAWTDIKYCMKNNGSQYLYEYHTKARNLDPKLEYFPHILFNDIADRDSEKSSRLGFVTTVCDMYQDDKPIGCLSSSAE